MRNWEPFLVLIEVFLKFAGRTARLGENTLSRLCLSLFIKGNLAQGRPFRKIKDAISESLRIIIPSMPESGDYE